MKKTKKSRENNTVREHSNFYSRYSDTLFTASSAALAACSWAALWLAGVKIPLLFVALAGANFYTSFLMIIGVDTIHSADHLQTGEGFTGSFLAFFMMHWLNVGVIAAFPAILAVLIILGAMLRILSDRRGGRILWCGLSVNCAVILMLLYLFMRIGNSFAPQLERSFAGTLSGGITLTASLVIASLSLVSLPVTVLCLTPGRIYSHGARFARMQGLNPLPGLLAVSVLRSLCAAAMIMTVGICGFAGHYLRHLPGKPMGTLATLFIAMMLINGIIAAGLFVPLRFLIAGIVILSYLLHLYHRTRRIYLYDRM